MEVMNREAAKLGLQVLFHELLGAIRVAFRVAGSPLRASTAVESMRIGPSERTRD